MSDAERMLMTGRTLAVVGLSSRATRPSYGVTRYMQSAGYRIIPVNPAETEVLAEKAYATLDDVKERIDIVNIFRRAECAPEIVEAAIRVGAKGIWMQEGIAHAAAAARAKAAGLLVAMDTCILKVHAAMRREGKLPR